MQGVSLRTGWDRGRMASHTLLRFCLLPVGELSSQSLHSLSLQPGELDQVPTDLSNRLAAYKNNAVKKLISLKPKSPIPLWGRDGLVGTSLT